VNRPDTGLQPDVALLAECRGWLDRERGLSPVSVRCYSKQSKAFLAGIGGAGAVSELDAGRVTAFMVGWTQGRNAWSAKAMVTSLRAFLRFAHATGRTAVPLAGAVPAVASWQMTSLPRGLKAAEIERLLGGCERDTAAGPRDYAVLSLLARLGLRGAEAAGLQLGDIGWRAGEIAVTGKGSRTERLPLSAAAGEALAAWMEHGRPKSPTVTRGQEKSDWARCCASNGPSSSSAGSCASPGLRARPESGKCSSTTTRRAYCASTVRRSSRPR
jgi:site-specific recombinase XerC